MNNKILIVDDEKHMLGMLTKALEKEDRTITSVLSGEEALEYIKNYEVDLVITDVSMPKMQGTELCFKLKSINPFLQVIVITGYPKLEIIARMLEAGASDFILKPFDLICIQNIVEETITRINRWKALRKQ
ncbi:MAG: response regulator [Candidatus Omnitrophota bacterium]|nr:MAG: response regulator [Candidatus Omnitrophota bacterium]